MCYLSKIQKLVPFFQNVEFCFFFCRVTNYSHYYLHHRLHSHFHYTPINHTYTSFSKTMNIQSTQGLTIEHELLRITGIWIQSQWQTHIRNIAQWGTYVISHVHTVDYYDYMSRHVSVCSVVLCVVSVNYFNAILYLCSLE